jgi:hypothetical protein
MRKFAAMFFILVAFGVCNPKVSTSMDFTRFQWKNRLLFLFAEDANDPFFKNLQGQIIAQKAEVEDRDLIVFEMPAKGPARMGTTPLNRQQADSVRHHFDIPGDAFSLILVGKDGGIKFRCEDCIDLKAVFDLIDSMPMRRREMHQKSR